MKNAGPILGFNSYKFTTIKIIKTLKWVTINHLIITESVKLIQKVAFENIIKSITQYITFSLCEL